MSETDQIVAWCQGPGRHVHGIGPLIGGFAEQLVSAGVPVTRMTMSWQTLHPQALVAAYYLDADQGSREVTVPYGADLTSAYLKSPIRLIFEGAEEVRRTLSGPSAKVDFPILDELKERGIVEYLALPVTFSDDVTHAVTFATTATAGFSEDHVSLVRNALIVFGPIAEVQAVRQIARTILETYLGQASGPKVLEWSITRGDLETIDAALWYCDLRDFTGLSQTLSSTEIISLLNDYFGVAESAIETHGGEILKFIGDAVLAIFPLGSEKSTAEVLRNASAAACEALASRSEIAADKPDLDVDFGVALHVGRVANGNVGAPNRLDFTVIGPAVNLVGRIAGLCGELMVPYVASDAFVTASEESFRPLGTFSLKGIAKPEAIFTLSQDLWESLVKILSNCRSQRCAWRRSIASGHHVVPVIATGKRGT